MGHALGREPLLRALCVIDCLLLAPAKAGPYIRFVNPFRNIMRLSVGDFIAKTLTFAAFVWLARVLGVQTFGVLEFANSLLAWFLLLADGGLELWATRESAKTQNVPALVARVVPLRFLLATASFVLLFLLLPLMPPNENLRVVMALFGLSLFAQAASLKWLFLGREQMARVGTMLVAGQMVFAIAVIALIRRPEQVLWVPLVKFAADTVMAIGFARIYRREHGSLLLPYTFAGARIALAPAVTMGLTQAMGLLNFNFDSILIGFLLGLKDVGLYNAAYKPVTMFLAGPLTYFTGLFPVLSRAWHEGPEKLRPVVERSLRMCALLAFPVGVAVSLLAMPIVELVFGAAYRESAAPLAVLIWSAVLVILRGSYRHALNAAGFQRLDLRGAIWSSAVNVGMNIALIPRYGLMGAAIATVGGDVVWFVMSYRNFQRHVMKIPFLPNAWRALAASLAMGLAIYFVPTEAWSLQAAAGAAVLVVALLSLGEPFRTLRAGISA